jgi:hypothetical protein
MSWTYRVRKRRINDTEIMFGLAEVYETASGASNTERWKAPVAVCSPDDPLGDVKAIAELRRQLMGMTEALSKPILQDSDTAERPAPSSIEDRQSEDTH